VELRKEEEEEEDDDDDDDDDDEMVWMEHAARVDEMKMHTEFLVGNIGAKRPFQRET
jgi:hypothetical protein